MPFDNSNPDVSQAICRRAAELIDTPDKWCKHAAHNWDGQRCLIGALSDAYSELVGSGLATHNFSWFLDVQSRIGTAGFESLAMFNDDANTTHADVIKLLREYVDTPPYTLTFRREVDLFDETDDTKREAV